ncbi:hypothetical protein L873DRAFT_1785590 [Choiromyces venosus 120613-1]|uniref:Uncharacterized protein n=1 Tax=Choiromyces venosus 120613-1 TaxID=1336337 RepID=A0A3N4K7C9_9PEZI|nr:hypothetical protein L873DRAFT_1785590 [Choiromyces venosus 120613-1]
MPPSVTIIFPKMHGVLDLKSQKRRMYAPDRVYAPIFSEDLRKETEAKTHQKLGFSSEHYECERNLKHLRPVVMYLLHTKAPVLAGIVGLQHKDLPTTLLV